MVSLEHLQQYSQMLQKIRSFFAQRHYLEVYTPLLCKNLIPESHIDIIPALLQSRDGELKKTYLPPSPEYSLKKIIAEYQCNIFEVAKSFRNMEESSPHHSHEFHMLEFYTMHTNSNESLHIFTDLLRTLSQLSWVSDSVQEILFSALRKKNLTQLFKQEAQLDLDRACRDISLLKEACKKISLSQEGDWEILFHRLFFHCVEPQLSKNEISVIYNYPVNIPVLAHLYSETSFDRWEAYVGSIELANCYSEETDAEKIRAYMEGEAKEKKKKAQILHPYEKNYLSTPPLPSCSGVALGLDRLYMILSGEGDIRKISLCAQ